MSENSSARQLDEVCADVARRLRTGIPEVIFCKGKTAEQVLKAVRAMVATGENVIATKATREQFLAVSREFPQAKFNETAGVFTYRQKEYPQLEGKVSIVTAGTSDIPFAEEAYETLCFLGAKAHKCYDIGVAGIHRVYEHLDLIRDADVIIVFAGMEGALPSVIGGLVSSPIIAVPTSVGYGASFAGLAALLGMLNSCVPGITVVNIDNGFGAAVAATLILRRITARRQDGA